MSINNSSINSMQDVYSILKVTRHDSFEYITQNYHNLLQNSSTTNSKNLKKAYKLMGVIYGQVEYAHFNDWYNTLAHELSTMSSDFQLFEGNFERISIIDYLEPEIFLDAFLKNYTSYDFAREFYNDTKTKELIEEAKRNKTDIESSLQRMSDFV